MASHTQVNLSRHFAGLGNMMLAGLLIESTTSFVVIIASFRGWAIDSSWYESSFSTCLATQPAFQLLAKFLCLQGLQISKRAAAETALRLVANIVGFCNALAIIFFSQHDTLKKPFVNMLPLEQGHGHVKHPHTTPAPKDKRRCLQLGITVFPCFAILATAMWAGAVTPMKSTVAIQSTVDIPHFGSSITTTEFAVSGSVGTALLSKLLSITASSVLFSNGSISRQTTSHNAGFFYRGRSYGVGSFVGIRDQMITENPSTSAYHFRQSGYLPHIMCQYNKSMDFHIDREYPHRTFAVIGFLPDSVGSAQ
ncbi:hypothetical protein BDP55DRAFT_631944 [Colletotrichum godetiae]|uniref:Uncharacterized protein n=1 Tax=Colletotrichum godetiae TaxID=1209918 RepID=A0AAJ0EU44_9PEZI|nr:uncharacterized protein BDP55DRAFT_631944 [Colletotrichum godetiae]KAK1675757.1 hypothetical protein BDP55DRAFT_631944 [Colletotrichum godetiae]